MYVYIIIFYHIFLNITSLQKVFALLFLKMQPQVKGARSFSFEKEKEPKENATNDIAEVKQSVSSHPL